VARLFVAGDSAGCNIVPVRAAAPSIEGAILLHPFFCGNAAIDRETEHAAAIGAKVWAYLRVHGTRS
jgi:hypothetical protein